MATITARVDQTDKENFIAFCTNAGLNASIAINMFVKAVLRENHIPFEITISNDPFYSEVNMEHLRKSVAQLRRGEGTVHELIEVDDE